MALLGIVCTAVFYLGPVVLGLLFEAVSTLKEKYGGSGLLVTLSIVGIVLVMVFASVVDTRQNRAIRAGSKIAFDKRVKDLMRDQHYSLEDATTAAAKVRDEKKK
jgi:hypothetical protein